MGLVLSYLQSGSGAAWNTALALAILAGIVYLPFWRSSRNFWPAVLEMATAGLVLGLGIPLDYEFLPYLLTAGAYWGLRGGWLPSLTGVGAAAVTLLTLLASAARAAEPCAAAVGRVVALQGAVDL